MKAECTVPNCIGYFRFSNVHKPAETCNMNVDGTDTGCDQPESHHQYENDSFDTVCEVLRQSDIVWAKYGSDSIENLAERILVKIPQ